MTGFLDHTRTHMSLQFKRHLRSPALWLLALAAPIAAKYMVPSNTADYIVMSVNDAYINLTPSVIGLQLGVVMAIVLSPLAYIFLRAGPTRHVPWQAEDVTPANRSAQFFGNWLGDTAALWILMIALAVAGVILSCFRLPLSDVNPFQTCLSLIIIAAPALAVIAALRTFMSTRPALRRAWGDVLFFIMWLFLVTLSAIFFASSGTGSPIFDVFGYAAPIGNAVDVPVESMVIGSSPAAVESMKSLDLDAMSGVLNTGYLASRVFWIAVSAAVVVFAGSIFKGRTPKLSKVVPKTQVSTDTAMNSPMRAVAIPATKPNTVTPTALLISDLRQMLQPRVFFLILIMVAIAGAILPFRGMAGPAITLALIFPLTAHGSRWQGRALRGLTSVMPTPIQSQFIWRLIAAIILAAIVCMPAIIRAGFLQSFIDFKDAVAVILIVPGVAIGLGAVARSAVPARLLLLIGWYMYLNLPA